MGEQVFGVEQSVPHDRGDEPATTAGTLAASKHRGGGSELMQLLAVLMLEHLL